MPDVAPTVSIALDKPAGVAGSLVTVTVKYTPGSKSTTVRVDLTDAAGATGSATVAMAKLATPVTLSITDTDGRAWTKVTDDGKTAVYQATV